MLKHVLSRFHRWLGRQLAEPSIVTQDAVDFQVKAMRLLSVLPNGPEAYQLKHYFTPASTGYLYAREVFVPKGHVIVGKLHKHSHLVFLMQGKLLVATAKGKQILTAPCTIVADAGMKAAITLEDTIWTTAHLVETTNLAKIEAELIAAPGLLPSQRLELT